MVLGLSTFTAPSAKSWRRMRTMSKSSSSFLGLGSRRQSRALPGTRQGRPAGCAEDAGRVMHGQSRSSPSRHTWTSTRFATWLPEHLVPRAGHRGDGAFYLICLSGFNHLKPPSSCSAHCFLPFSAPAGPRSLQLKNPLQKVEGGGSTSWLFSSVCDYYRCPGPSELPLA